MGYVATEAEYPPRLPPRPVSSAIEITPSAPLFLESTPPPEVIIGTLDSGINRAQAIDFITQGTPIVFQVRRVFGILLNGADPSMTEAACALKNDPDKNRPFSAMMKTERFLSYVDYSRIHPEMAKIMSDPHIFNSTVASVCHIRAPITPEAVAILPKPMVSYQGDVPYMHNLSLPEHPVYRLVQELDASGIPFVAVTTLNPHKSQEITHLGQALEFCLAGEHQGKIPLVLTDPTPLREGILGSFPIVDITKRPNEESITLLRHGHVPAQIVERIIGIPLSTDQAKPAAFDTIDFSHLLAKDLSHLSLQQIRDLAIAFMSLR